ncbi:Hypothetical protein R9X50_00308300 [Acrodontium crateriforme]|uniref:Ubiquinone biosynthesis O-methyltransferase, mitochondrial n=1 Tax=Acrodontium crateriforme TaxID=150365 RepID=A0AAQ3M271_9PEZI|nr:Hypothetical protein R9X50_00308300 [Acrodontium crateriforme]
MANPMISRLTALPSGLRVFALRRFSPSILTSTFAPNSQHLAGRRHHGTESSSPNAASSSVNQTEVSHFNTLASEWWDPHGSSRLLHLMNPLRHDFIRQCLRQDASHDPSKKIRYMDIGCGGGIFAESAARLSNTASVTGIDPTPQVFAVAKRHQRTDPYLLEKNPETGEPRLKYLNTSIEGLVDHPKETNFDIISLFEVIEHIQRPSPFLQACLQHLKPGGWLIGSTMARTNTSWFTTKFVAEEVLKMVPRGTHDWNQYIQPEELRSWARTQPDLAASSGTGWHVMGVVYVPGLGWREINGSETWGNYFFAMQKRI